MLGAAATEILHTVGGATLHLSAHRPITGSRLRGGEESGQGEGHRNAYANPAAPTPFVANAAVSCNETLRDPADLSKSIPVRPVHTCQQKSHSTSGNSSMGLQLHAVGAGYFLHPLLHPRRHAHELRAVNNASSAADLTAGVCR